MGILSWKDVSTIARKVDLPKSKLAEFDAAVNKAEQMTGEKLRGTKYYNQLFREYFRKYL